MSVIGRLAAALAVGAVTARDQACRRGRPRSPACSSVRSPGSSPGRGRDRVVAVVVVGVVTGGVVRHGRLRHATVVVVGIVVRGVVRHGRRRPETALVVVGVVTRRVVRHGRCVTPPLSSLASSLALSSLASWFGRVVRHGRLA